MATDSDVFRVFARVPDEAEPLPGIRALSVRMPTATYVWLSAMAEHADLSRNAMAVQLIRWGIEAAMGKLPDDLRDEIHGDVIAAIQNEDE